MPMAVLDGGGQLSIALASKPFDKEFAKSFSPDDIVAAVYTCWEDW